MKKLIDLSNDEAKAYFLKGSSYFRESMPSYISFDPILSDVAALLNGRYYTGFKSDNPDDFPKVSYCFLANKDGKLAWRPFELIHPVIYVSLVNLICNPENWEFCTKRWSEYEEGVVECCGAPVVSLDSQKDVAAQVRSWWRGVEQRSLVYSLEFSHVLHTDVTDCYGSTHSIAWALHGIEESKRNKREKSLGNMIDSHIRASRYGQTNGISQGSVLMDFVAELVLSYVDEQINSELGRNSDFRVLRYRDDYRIFTNSDDMAEHIVKVISERLSPVGMRLGVSKTFLSRNVVEGSVKPDKLAGIDLQDLGQANARTMQKQLLRLHSFGQRFPNSGALRRLVSEFHIKIREQTDRPEDLEVQVAIAADIGFVSPGAFPAVAAILSHLISLASAEEKPRLWAKVRKKMARVPFNGYLDIWLQRVTQSKGIGEQLISDEPICQIVNGGTPELWENRWVASKGLKEALSVSRIVVGSVSEAEEVIEPKEIALFMQNALSY